MLLLMPPPASLPPNAGISCLILRDFGVGPTWGEGLQNMLEARLVVLIHLARAFLLMQVAVSEALLLLSVSPSVWPPPRGPLCESPRPQKLPKLGDSCNLHSINAPSNSLDANSTAKRAHEATGGDGRTPKIQKDLRATKDLRAPVHINGSACIRGSGLCPLTGWTIADYCPACHG